MGFQDIDKRVFAANFAVLTYFSLEKSQYIA